MADQPPKAGKDGVRSSASDAVAALFVQTGGVYFGLEGVEPWDEQRDARKYAGPHPVVAHPPCERWGRYWHGGPSAKVRRVKGDDGGCFREALRAVWSFGGVIEHPEASGAWRAFGLIEPPRSGGWVFAGLAGGWTCCVEQGHYGYRGRKATWLYAFGVRELPSLMWGRSRVEHRIDGCGFHTSEERKRKLGGKSRAAWLAERGVVLERPSEKERAATPIAFRDLLLSIARTARRSAAA